MPLCDGLILQTRLELRRRGFHRFIWVIPVGWLAAPRTLVYVRRNEEPRSSPTRVTTERMDAPPKASVLIVHYTHTNQALRVLAGRHGPRDPCLSKERQKNERRTKDVLIAAYLFEDLAKKDFDAVVRLAEDKAITVEGVVLVQKDDQGEVAVKETGDHLGQKGAKVGGGVGLVVGALRSATPAATAVGAACRSGDREVRQTSAREWDRREDGLGAAGGSGGVIAVYDSGGADAVDKALSNASRSVAQIDGLSAKELKAGLAEAQSGMGGN